MLYVFFARNENSIFLSFRAILAQLVEHLIRNQAVGGSNPLDGSIILWVLVEGKMATVDSLPELSDTILRDIEKGVDILKSEGCKSIYIFGSVAEGRVTERSDIDFAVRGCPPDKFYNLQGKLLLELTRSTDLIDLDSDVDLASFLEREATLIHVG